MEASDITEYFFQQTLATTSNNDIIRADIRETISLVNRVILSPILCICGAAANIINMAVFFKQGLGDSATICLFALALADFLAVSTLLVHDVCFVPVLRYSDTPYETTHIEYLIASWPHIACSRLIAWLTAFISFERCICISMPLKVKSILTPKRTTIIVTLLFFVMATSVTPAYLTTSFGWRFFPNRNKTLIGLVFISENYRNYIEKISFAVSGTFFSITTFLSVGVFSSLLVVNLHQKTKWRSVASSSHLLNAKLSNNKPHNGHTFQKRDEKIAKMIFLISVIFIICFLPSFIMFAVIIFDPRFIVDTGKYRNITGILFSCSCVTEPLHSNIGSVIYYHMSSKYRNTLKQLFMRKLKA